jgi:hypothetical protein
MGGFVSGGLRDLLMGLAAIGAMLVLSGCSMWRGTPEQQAYWACMAQHPEPKSNMDKAADVAAGAGSYVLLKAIGSSQDATDPAHRQWVANERQCQIMAFGHE